MKHCIIKTLHSWNEPTSSRASKSASDSDSLSTRTPVQVHGPCSSYILLGGFSISRMDSHIDGTATSQDTHFFATCLQNLLYIQIDPEQAAVHGVLEWWWRGIWWEPSTLWNCPFPGWKAGRRLKTEKVLEHGSVHRGCTCGKTQTPVFEQEQHWQKKICIENKIH